MTRNCSLAFLIGLSINPAIILDRNRMVVVSNEGADRLGFRVGTAFFDVCAMDGPAKKSFVSCYTSTNRKRFLASVDTGSDLEAVGWRLAGPFRSDGLIVVHFLDIATARTHFVVAKKDRQHARQSQKLRSINTTLTRENEELGNLVTVDAMTGLMNATAFRIAVRDRIAAGKAFALLYLDLNRLKLVNDTLGHHAGDTAILKLAHAIQCNIRGDDLSARLGGDEFAILAAGYLTEDTIETLVGRIGARISCAAQNAKLTRSLQYSAAVGAAFWPTDAADPVTLESYADQAMYKSKRLGLPVFMARDLDHGPVSSRRVAGT